ncbi:phage head closure protein [Clostridium sp.]|uniref:phage head closure protein n=1 Tax=Clostridium sp. TaxID=1506 RepID=UPI003992C5C7
MIMNERIEIKQKIKNIVDGRWVESYEHYYKCWCTPLELYGEELYAAMNNKHENILYFKVRYCNKIKAMRKTDKKKFIVIFEGVEYEVFTIDFKQNKKDWVYIKTKMVI